MTDTTTIDHLSALANLPLTAQEKAEFAPQIPEILKYVDAIQKLDLASTPPTNQVTHKVNELRSDEITPSLTQEQALSGATHTHKGFFVVPATIDYDA